MDVLEKLALWIGWAPIAILEFLFMVVAKFFYERELSNKETTIQRLNRDLENSKQYQVDVLVQSLSERVKAGNEEIERLRADAETSTAELEERENQQRELYQKVVELKARLKDYENDLDNLIDDYCDICDPDEDHPGANIIMWGSAIYPLTGLEELIQKVGSCNYCNSPQIKCNVCGSITSINLDDYDKVECAGGCGVMYQIVVNHREHDYEIEVSRKDD
jgi:hypothetical protein